MQPSGAWPGRGELCWTRRGRAGPVRAKPQMSPGVSLRLSRAPESRVTQALLDSDYCSFNCPGMALHPHALHQPSSTPHPPDVWYSFQSQPKHTVCPRRSRNPRCPRGFREGAGCSCLSWRLQGDAPRFFQA